MWSVNKEKRNERKEGRTKKKRESVKKGKIEISV